MCSRVPELTVKLLVYFKNSAATLQHEGALNRKGKSGHDASAAGVVLTWLSSSSVPSGSLSRGGGVTVDVRHKPTGGQA